jgi:hypothetical protein
LVVSKKPCLYRTSISPIFTEQIVLGLRDYFTRVWGEHAFGAGIARGNSA